MRFPLRSHARAFTTGEVIISMFLLSVGLVGIMSLISRSLQYAFSNRDRIVAAELAQEGVELVRNFRDNNYASGQPAFTGFDQSSKHCREDYTSTGLNCDHNQQSVSFYRLNYQDGLYQHGGTGTTSRFSRYIRVDYNPGINNDALVTSFVFWGSADLPPNSGSTSSCNALATCVYTQLYLSDWKT